mmetsp:Transcript_75936/g.180546  ORF Transcript_75936/g.180546 Transcript_75936/m.180546 type:complete len:539 (+) Transcript_75936:111-1727(+)
MGLRKFIRKTVGLQARGDEHLRSNEPGAHGSLTLEATDACNEAAAGLLPKVLEDDIFGPGDKNPHEVSYSSRSNLDNPLQYIEANELTAFQNFAPHPPMGGIALNVPTQLDEAGTWTSGSEPEVEAEPMMIQSGCNPIGLAVSHGGTFEMKDINLCSQRRASYETADTMHLGSSQRGFSATAPAFVPLPNKSGGRPSTISTASTRASLTSLLSAEDNMSALELEVVATQMDMQAAQLLAAAERVERAAAMARAQAAGSIAMTQAEMYPQVEDPYWAQGSEAAMYGSVDQTPWGYNTGYYQDWMTPTAYGAHPHASQFLPQQQFARSHMDKAGQKSGAMQQQPQQQQKKKKAGAAAGAAGSARNANNGTPKGESMLVPDEERTTIMLRNIPNNYTRVMLQDLLDGKGFAGRYDFIYLPMDFRSAAGLGYAFVNLTTHHHAEEAFSKFQGFSEWKAVSQKVCEVAWGHPLQGFEAHVERYRNSPVMHKDVQEEFRPAIYKDGVQIPFPAPTKAVHAPRNKRGKPEGAASAAAAAPEGLEC